ncbi:hypothetical protein [Cupriavidus sp. IK-TO18]|uniref:IS1096 element passenger TnpR family protein n=1 Tax=Cupriavidus sp. IK-TO18 TaxID=2782182 RepID=UPI0018989276|nr:hypothetical protein [Cupriavidus sp. IK-TO18]
MYDFNAWWRHEIRVERRLLRQYTGRLPCCVAGFGPCPPEDIGGIERYVEEGRNTVSTSSLTGSSRCARVQLHWKTYAMRSTGG